MIVVALIAAITHVAVHELPEHVTAGLPEDTAATLDLLPAS
jgi:hypothetical protein